MVVIFSRSHNFKENIPQFELRVDFGGLAVEIAGISGHCPVSCRDRTPVISAGRALLPSVHKFPLHQKHRF